MEKERVRLTFSQAGGEFCAQFFGQDTYLGKNEALLGRFPLAVGFGSNPLEATKDAFKSEENK